MTEEPFFRREGDLLVPADPARGPWDRESLHGRVTAGLIGSFAEQRHGSPDFHPARLTVDMFRLARHAPVEVRTALVRDGNRIRVVDGTVLSDGVEVGRGSVVFLRSGEQPPGEVWSPEPWDAPHPTTIDPPAPRAGTPQGWTPSWETRPIAGAMGSPGQKSAWLRENRPFIDDEAPSAFVRAALACDFTNPFANSGSAGLSFINADVTLYLHRLPVDEWIGFHVVQHHSHGGVAVGQCALYDPEGPIGLSTVCGLAQQQRRG